ncbi:MAG: DUF2460 domain-containing protein [Pseudomonadota bacterium]
MSGFHEVLFPARLALGATGGPQRQTEVITLASGRELRNATWAESRRRWTLGSAIDNLAALQVLLSFFEARQGRLFGFRFRDPLDHSSASAGSMISSVDQMIGIGDGSTTEFQLAKDYGGVSRRIRKPVIGTVQVAVSGAQPVPDWSADAATGLVSFSEAPPVGAEISAGFEFDCPVRFDSDRLEGVVEAFGAGRVVSVDLVELSGV